MSLTIESPELAHAGVVNDASRAADAAVELECGPVRRLEALSTALRDLRLIIDSFTPSDADLLGVLAGFRHRTAKLLRKQGIETAWRVEEVDDHPLTPQQALHLLRILQEAVTNVVRHARARCITLGVRQNAGRVVIDIEDDGIGMGGAEPGTGLGNMQERARLMGSTVEIGSGGTGTRVRITLG